MTASLLTLAGIVALGVMSPGPDFIAVTQAATPGALTGFVTGLTVALANPKAAIFYASALIAVAPLNASCGLLSSMVLVVLLVAATTLPLR
jgi:threonine/homoserine/homoserine lactone efflux protein